VIVAEAHYPRFHACSTIPDGDCAAAATGETRTPTTPTAPTCTYTLSANTLNIAATGATATVGVTANSGCAWTATSNASFVVINSGSSSSGTATVGLTVAENTGDSRTGTLTVAGQTVTVTQAASDALFGNWSGSISKGAGCPASLPSSVTWTGTVRRSAIGQAELVINAPQAGVFNQTLPLTVSGNQISFAVQIDAVYTFVATLAADRRSFTGTFAGSGCSGTWSGTRT
jgi:hypothetical protein